MQYNQGKVIWQVSSWSARKAEYASNIDDNCSAHRVSDKFFVSWEYYLYSFCGLVDIVKIAMHLLLVHAMKFRMDFCFLAFLFLEVVLIGSKLFLGTPGRILCEALNEFQRLIRYNAGGP